MTTNWAGNVTFSASEVHHPSSVDELIDLVVAAPRLRTVGSRHSFNRIADTPGVQIAVDRLPRQLLIDDKNREVTVAAGVRYGDLVEELDHAGWALPNLASLPHISIGGTIATGTHGSGDRRGSLASAVKGLQIVKPDGEVHDFWRGDDDVEGMVVSLGSLGVVTYVTLDLEPAYEMRQEILEGVTWAVLDDRLDEIMAAADSVSLFTNWGPDGIHQAWLKSRTDVPPTTELFGATRATRQLHPLPGIAGDATTRQLGQPGPWWDRLPHFRMAFTPSRGDELQTEYLVPRDRALDAIAAVRAIAATVQPLLLVSELRSVAGDDLWLSPSHSVDCLAIHFTWRLDAAAVDAVLPVLDDALAPFAARPHWGKVFSTTPERLRSAYPRLDDFRTLAAWFDPTGKLRNDQSDAWFTP